MRKFIKLSRTTFKNRFLRLSFLLEILVMKQLLMLQYVTLQEVYNGESLTVESLTRLSEKVPAFSAWSFSSQLLLSSLINLASIQH